VNTPLASRSNAASHSVVNAVRIGTPASVVLGYLQGIITTKYGIPAEVTGAALALLVAGGMATIQYFSRGGRKGEPS